jgi:lipoxygenase
MALIADKVLQSTVSVSLFAGQSKLHPRGRSLPRRSHCPVTRKTGVAYSVQSPLRTSEPLTTVRPVDNGSASPASKNGAASAPVRLHAYVTIRKKRRPSDEERRVEMMDVLADRLGQKITLQLVSVDVDPEGGIKKSEVSSIVDWVEKSSVVADKVQYTAEFNLEKGFGLPGAIIINNTHQSEFFLESISLFGHSSGAVHFPTHSWVHAERNNPVPRTFFSNKEYLPSLTPKGLQQLREEDLKTFRGDGKGERKDWVNIYDYDIYNDLDDVDTDIKLSRPILGGSEEFPYPRRTRTGRCPTQADPSRESRVSGNYSPYVPRDEQFEPIKQESYTTAQLKGLVQMKFPGLRESLLGSPDEFDSFEDIDRLYCEGITITKRRRPTADGVEPPQLQRTVEVALRDVVKTVEDVVDTVKDWPMFGVIPDPIKQFVVEATRQPTTILRYPCPKLLTLDRYAWMRDDEFGRQALVGINPTAIQLLEVFPPVSSLDDVELYGPKESDIKAYHIEGRMEGYSIERALEEKKLYILDYHDVFLPYIERINSQQGRKGYASRTIFFLTQMGTPSPLVIELSLPRYNTPGHPTRQVFVPGQNPTQYWMWKHAKAHVSCNDAGYHQLVSHWLKTHASVEPYVIATNRQLSPLHPVFKLLHPHFRYTLEINSAARQRLISSGGVIEQVFLPGEYSMEMSSKVYGSKWRFDEQGLPQDLIARGVAEEDSNSEMGLKLHIDDYPFAMDGLLVWSTIKSWVTDYVSIYYKNPETIQQDKELQSWWEEIRVRGHADKKDEDWWPQLETEQDLIDILTTMMWITSGLHAAVNFGQYDYTGYMPNRPTLMRRHIPQPNTPEYEEFLANPQEFFLKSVPSQLQSVQLMAVVESLSTHSLDEEYLGSDTLPNWFGCPEAAAAYKRFQERILEVDRKIQDRNEDRDLRNRTGAVLPYELLRPWSKPGVTGQGIPNSISI